MGLHNMKTSTNTVLTTKPAVATDFELNGAQLTVRLLEQQGITHIAGIPGGANLPLYDALVDSSITHLLTRHEQGAGFIAQGMARVSGKPQVCFASSGPGATNLITAIADAKMDSVPLIAITGQVAQSMLGTDAFQEVDTFGLMLPITKHNYMVRSAQELLSVIPEAFQIATSGRPGPVAIDIPKDVQLESIVVDKTLPHSLPDIIPLPDAHAIQGLVQLLSNSKQPILMVGGGAVQSQCHQELLQLAEIQQLPIVCSFMGLGVIPSRHPLNLGMLGMHGARTTNYLLEECDLLIAAGVRFDDRATGKASEFCPQAKIVHIDIDASEIDKIKTSHVAIRADLGATLKQLLAQTKPMRRTAWIDRVRALQQKFPSLSLRKTQEKYNELHPYRLLPFLDELTKQQAIVVTDVGQHQMWTAQAFPFSKPRQWISSGGLGTMGFGLPAAIGAAIVEPDRPIICISGDGSLLMNIQELDTLAELQANVKVIVLNNQSLGLVRQQQTLFYNNRHKALNNSRPLRFAPIAEAMGIRGVDLSNVKDPLALIRLCFHKPGPCLIDIPIDENAKVFPMVPPGAANREMIDEDR